MNNGKAVIGYLCKGCGRCVSECPEKAMSLKADDMDSVFSQLLKRVSEVADIG